MADYIKIDDAVEKAIGRPRRTIIKMIIAGSIKGRQFSKRDTRIDVSELPSSFFANNPQVEKPEVEIEIGEPSGVTTPKRIVTLIPEAKNTKAEVSPELQSVQDAIKLADAKVKKIEAENKLKEAEGLRDLPDKIAKRDAESIQRDEVSRQRELAVAQRELIIAQNELDLKSKEQGMVNQVKGVEDYIKAKTDEANKSVIQAENYAKEKRSDADAYYAGKTTEANVLDNLIQTKQEELAKITNDVNKEVNTLIQAIQKWSGVADKEATKSYRISEKASGKREWYHTNRANSLWGLKDSLNKILKAIGG